MYVYVERAGLACLSHGKLGMARNSNRIANAAELDAYIADLATIIKNPETLRRTEARIRARACNFGVTMANENSGWNMSDSTDSTFVGRK